MLNVRVRGTHVHAPLLERLLEIPMDISAGEVVDGELRVVADDAASWDFPRVYGKLVVRGEGCLAGRWGKGVGGREVLHKHWCC